MPNKITLNQYRLWVSFRQTYDLLSNYEKGVFVKTDLTYEQFLALWILIFIREVKGISITLSDIAPLLNRTINTVSELVERMERNGLVKRVKDSSDKRATRIIVTQRGEAAFFYAAKPNLNLVNKLFSIFTDEEIQTLLNLTRKIRNVLKKQSHLKLARYDQDFNNHHNLHYFLNILYK